MLVPIVNILAGKKYWREKQKKHNSQPLRIGGKKLLAGEKKTQLTTSTYEFWREYFFFFVSS